MVNKWVRHQRSGCGMRWSINFVSLIIYKHNYYARIVGKIKTGRFRRVEGGALHVFPSYFVWTVQKGWGTQRWCRNRFRTLIFPPIFSRQFLLMCVYVCVYRSTTQKQTTRKDIFRYHMAKKGMEIGGTGIRNVGDDKDDLSSSFSSYFCFALYQNRSPKVRWGWEKVLSIIFFVCWKD